MSLVKSLLYGTAGGGEQSGQTAGRQQGASGGAMKLVRRLTQGTGGPMLTGATMLASAYRTWNRKRGRSMVKAALGLGLVVFGLRQRRRRSRGVGGRRQGGQSWQEGGQQRGTGGTGQYGGRQSGGESGTGGGEPGGWSETGGTAGGGSDQYEGREE